MIALWMMDNYRKKHNMHFRICNQIHDAIMLEVPVEEIDSTKQIFKDTLGSIHMPLPGTSKTLCLDVDLKVLSRWGEEYKEE